MSDTNKEKHMGKTKKQGTERYAIIANKSYGLYDGIVEKVETQPDGTLHVTVRECRHVAQWYGKTGGITSLAAHGLCGPSAGESRIGAPVRALLTGVVNIFDASQEARTSIESAMVS